MLGASWNKHFWAIGPGSLEQALEHKSCACNCHCNFLKLSWRLCRTMLGASWNPFYTLLGNQTWSSWAGIGKQVLCLVTARATFPNSPGDSIAPCWGQLGTLFKHFRSYLSHFWVIFDSCLSHFWVMFESFLSHIWVICYSYFVIFEWFVESFLSIVWIIF